MRLLHFPDNERIFLKKIIGKIDREIERKIIENYHSYLPQKNSIGRKISYLIYFEDELIGTIGFTNAVYPPPKCLLKYLNTDRYSYLEKFFPIIINNWRFTLIKKIRNLGTQILKKARQKIKKDWLEKYKIEPQWIITFVHKNWRGAVYLADNWKFIGYTAGLPPGYNRKPVILKKGWGNFAFNWITKEELKDEYKKKVFIRRL